MDVFRGVRSRVSHVTHHKHCLLRTAGGRAEDGEEDSGVIGNEKGTAILKLNKRGGK